MDRQNIYIMPRVRKNLAECDRWRRVDTAPHRFFGLVHPSACLITDCSGWPIVFLVVLLGFLCFGPANVECFVLSLPERSLYCEYCTVRCSPSGRLTPDLRIM